MEVNEIPYQGSSLRYHKKGDGNKVLLCFHGYGQDSSSFDALRPEIFTKYTVYLFDLYFHGESLWMSRHKVLFLEDWKAILEIFLRTEGVERFSVFGFSMGGKFALASAECFPTKIDHLHLAAPDGIYKNFWYWLATSTWLSRGIFRTMVLRPGLYLALVRLLLFLRLMDDRVIKFANGQMKTPYQRWRVYSSWVVFRRLYIHKDRFASHIRHYGIPLTMYIGDKDRIIRWKKIQSFADQWDKNWVRHYASSHSLLLPKVLQEFE